MKPLPRALLAGGCAALLAACQTVPVEEEPAYVKATAVEARAVAVEGRVAVVERQAAALQELQRQLDLQSETLRRLRGEFEQLQQAAQQAGTEQHNLYTDLDRRLATLETKPPVALVNAGNVATVTDEMAYQAALARLRAKDYGGALAELERFPVEHPDSALRDNAAYWLGEVHYVERRFKEALQAFQEVVERFPDSRKRADALLKVGDCQVELRQWALARQSLTRVVSEFPDSPAAREARARLATFDGSGKVR